MRDGHVERRVGEGEPITGAPERRAAHLHHVRPGARLARGLGSDARAVDDVQHAVAGPEGQPVEDVADQHHATALDAISVVGPVVRSREEICFAMYA